MIVLTMLAILGLGTLFAIHNARRSVAGNRLHGQSGLQLIGSAYPRTETLRIRSELVLSTEQAGQDPASPN